LRKAKNYKFCLKKAKLAALNSITQRHTRPAHQHREPIMQTNSDFSPPAHFEALTLHALAAWSIVLVRRGQFGRI